jgi:probable phosphoglycerate mutase
MDDKRTDGATEFLLIRHGESEWNAASRWQGHADPPLSERGRGQARDRAQSLAKERIDALYTSDLKRAMETAAFLGEVLGKTPIVNARLRELDIGEWEGLVRAEIQERWPGPLQAFDTEDPDSRPTGGETRRELAARVRSCVSEIADHHPAGRVMIVSHMGVIESLLPGVIVKNAGLERALATSLRF